MSTSNKTKELAKQIRRLSIEMVHNAKASHIGGALSIADILAVLYSDVLNIYPLDPSLPQRDRFILSKGHACVSLYAALALKGFFPLTVLSTYSQNGSILLSHTSHKIPGVELSSGSLGHALPISCGLAIAAKKKGLSWKTYCLVSDGELDEGSNWESILFAPQLELDNLILIIDYNKIQAFGNVRDIIDLEPLKEKLTAFRWEVFEVNGHDISELKKVFSMANKLNMKPKAIIANTIKGKGISYMENRLLWHYKAPDKEQFDIAIKELGEK